MISHNKRSTLLNWSSPGVHDVVLKIVESLTPSDGRVLDLACGPGALADRLLRKGFQVTAADGFPEVFQFHGQVPFTHLNVEKEWDLLDGKFDSICAVEIIEHVENPYLFIRKCFQQLKPGGVLVCTTPNAAYYSSRLMFLHNACFELYSPRSFYTKTKTEKGNILPGHIHLFTSWMIKANLERAGFESIFFSSSNHWLNGLLPVPRRPLNLVRWFYYRLIGTLASPFMFEPVKSSIFSKNIIAVARKPAIDLAADRTQQ